MCHFPTLPLAGCSIQALGLWLSLNGHHGSMCALLCVFGASLTGWLLLQWVKGQQAGWALDTLLQGQNMSLDRKGASPPV